MPHGPLLTVYRTKDEALLKSGRTGMHQRVMKADLDPAKDVEKEEH